MKLCYLLIFSLVLAYSCKKSDDSKEPSGIRISLLNSFKAADSSDTVKYIFQYSDTGLIKITRQSPSGNPTCQMLRFDDQNRLTDYQVLNTAGNTLQHTTYNWNGNKVMQVTIDSTTFDYLMVDSLQLTLDENGYPVSGISYSSFNDHKPANLQYYWNNGDLIKETREMNSSTSTTTYVYDEAFNPMNFTNLPFYFPPGINPSFLFCGKHILKEEKSDGLTLFSSEWINANTGNYPVNLRRNFMGTDGNRIYQFEY